LYCADHYCKTEGACTVEKKRFHSSAKSRCWFCSFQFSRHSAAGSTLAVQQWKMLDPPVSGSSVARHSPRDWRPAVRTGMKWQRLAGVCDLGTVQVMPCGRENTDDTRFVYQLAANVVLAVAEQNWCGHARGFRSSTTRAATRRTRCNGARVDAGRPASTTWTLWIRVNVL